MSGRSRFIAVLLVVVVLLAAVAGVSAGANHVPVTGVEIPLCFGPDPPHPDCTDGEWTFPGGNQHVRNWGLVYAVDASDDRVTGTNWVLVNANWDANGFGPGWGTYHQEPAAHPGGYWEGTWTGQWSAEGYVIRIVGRGYGTLAGLKYRATAVTGGVCDGVILELP